MFPRLFRELTLQLISLEHDIYFDKLLKATKSAAFFQLKITMILN